MAEGLAFEAGLHRCPSRYPRLFVDPQTRELRKRIFYSIYVLDRLLSQALGSPLMLSDTDIDVCLPGAPEKHIAHGAADAHVGQMPGVSETISTVRFHAPSIPSVEKRGEPPSGDPEPSVSSPLPHGLARPTSHNDMSAVNVKPATPSNEIRLRAANSLVRIVAISGKLMEAFNKSAKYRADDREHRHGPVNSAKQ